MLRESTDFLSEIEDSVHHLADGSYRVDLSVDGFWIAVTNDRSLPRQGWKLHVSAGVASAAAVLRNVLPVLLAERANFKVAANPSILATLNGGFGGAFQIGKFITVYPAGGDEAVKLGRLLHQRTIGLIGPRVPTDRRVAEGSRVSYRYGAFSGTAIRNAVGETLPAMMDDAGNVALDVRKGAFDPPHWATDPFAEAGLGENLQPPSPVIAGRYFVLQALHHSARGSVLFALDIETRAKVVLKQASVADEIGNLQLEARSGIRREYDLLQKLSQRAPVARPLAYLTWEDSEYLVMEYQSAVSLEEWMLPRILGGALPLFEAIKDMAIQIADFLHILHEQDYVYGDLKSANVLVDQASRLIFLDFELTMPPGADLPADTGTRGYLSRARRAGLPTSTSDDLYALGALVYFLATGAEPSQAPDGKPLLQRSIKVMRPALSDAQSDQISSFVAWCSGDGAHKASAQEALSMLRAWRNDGESIGPGHRAPLVTVEPIQLAAKLGESLRRRAKDGPNGPHWISRHPLALSLDVGDWNTGSSGVVMALTALQQGDSRNESLPFLRAAAHALMRYQPLPGDPAGLYVGAAGRALALLRAGVALDEKPLVVSGETLIRSLDLAATTSPDLFNGVAGILRAQLEFHLTTGRIEYLTAGRRLGQELLRTCIWDARGARWSIPAGHAALSDKVYLGYAHGAAGIGDALLDLWFLTGDADLAACIRAVVTLLEQTACEIGPEDGGLNWPSEFNGQSVAAAYWCHGAAGIAQFLLRVHRAGLDGRARELARGGLESTSGAVRWSRPTPCHGLVGAIDTLLDGFLTLQEVRWLHGAQDLYILLKSFVIETEDGIEIETEAASGPTTDFMLGYAGIIPVLLRLAPPYKRESYLSLHGLFDRAAKQSNHV